MSAPILFINARIIDPASGTDERGSLLVKDGLIQGIQTGGSPSIECDTPDCSVIDCKGSVLAPGIVDMRAHDIDTDAALAGGITTLGLTPDQSPILDSAAEISRRHNKTPKNSGPRVLPIGAATKNQAGAELADIGKMQKAGAAAFGDANSGIANSLVLRRVLEYARHFDALVIDFAQDHTLSADGIVHEGLIARRLGLPTIPAEAEAIQVERDIRLLALTGGRLHFPLISSRQALEPIKNAQKRGLNVSAATAPHYLYTNELALEGFRSFAKVSPPLRSEEDRLALIEGVAEGVIDTIASDHHPQALDTKRLPFAQASFGLVGFETLLPLSLNLYHNGQLSLIELMERITYTPAKHLRIANDELGLGQLKVGTTADIILFDPDKPWKLERDSLKSRARNMLEDSLILTGQVQMTMINGQILFQHDLFQAEVAPT